MPVEENQNGIWMLRQKLPHLLRLWRMRHEEGQLRPRSLCPADRCLPTTTGMTDLHVPGKPKSESLHPYYARLQTMMLQSLIPINTLVCWERPMYPKEVEPQLQTVASVVHFSAATASLSDVYQGMGRDPLSVGPIAAAQPARFPP